MLQKIFFAEAKVKKVPLRHALFSQAYVMHRSAAISQLINFIHSGQLSYRGQQGRGFGSAVRTAWSGAETPGQFYFLLGLTKFAEYDKAVVPYVVRLLKNIRSYPYHLQLDLIDFSHHLRKVEEPFRTEIIGALNASLDKLGVMMNTVIFEALRSLGALEEEEHNHLEVIQREIQDALSIEGAAADQAAWGVFSRQFDHPFESLYWEEVQELDDVRRKSLLTKACCGAAKPFLSFLGILIRQLSKFDDPAVAFAIAPWTALPDEKHFMPQDAIEVFVAAHESLGHLGAELPEPRGEASTNVERALLACGELIYWSNRIDVMEPQTSYHTHAARAILLDHSTHASAGALFLTTSRMVYSDGTGKSLMKDYPDLAISICREAIKRREMQTSFYMSGFQDDVASIAVFSIQVLGALGKREDLFALRGLCDHEIYGVAALDAVKKIEERTNFK